MSHEIETRLVYHNSGKVKSTTFYKPWKLFYKEFIDSRENARIKEKYLKSGCGKEFLKSILSQGSSVG